MIEQTAEIVSRSVSKRLKAQKITFEYQAKKFLEQGATRKRNPLRPASLRTYKSQIEKNLIPLIGKVPLELVGNKAVKNVVAKLSEQGLSPRTIALNVMIIKKIRKSAVNDEGDPLYPATWNTEMIDAPEAEPMTQGSTITQEGVQEAISRAETVDKALYALLAGSGLRIAEALSIKLGPDDGVSSIWLPTENKIIVRQQRGRSGLAPTKTKAGIREVDLSGELTTFLVETFGTWKPGERPLGQPGELLFPGLENAYRVRLEKNGVSSGFHSFRRFRITHLNRMSTPTGLEYFWTGHAAGDVHGKYIMFGNEIETRKLEAARVGLGFKLPEVV